MLEVVLPLAKGLYTLGLQVLLPCAGERDVELSTWG